MKRELKRILVAALLIWPMAASAAISVGSYTFDNLAFADDATQVDAGNIELSFGAGDLDGALTGYSPTTGLFNIGFLGLSNANLFQLDFTDLKAANGAGADIVLFDARFSADPYSIAIRPAGGSFSTFLSYSTASQVNTGVAGPLGSVLWGIEIDISAYGFAAGTVVDAIRFSALPNVGGPTEGDPVMAAVLNGATSTVPEPGTLALLGLGLAGIATVRRRRQ